MRLFVRFFLLIVFYFSLYTTSSAQVDELLDRAKRIDAIIKNTDRLISKVSNKEPVTLPLGLSKGSNVIALDSMKFTSDGGELTAYLVAQIGSMQDSIGFAGKKVKFGPGGVEGGRLELIGNPSIDIGKNKLTIHGGGGTYVDFSCNGFEKAAIDGSVEFSNEFIKNSSNGSNVTGTFNATIDKDFDDIIVSATIPTSFEATKLKGFVFTVDSVTLDLSSKNNIKGMAFPADYTTDEKDNWQGFYAKKFSIQIPQGFKKEGSPIPSFTADSLLIDRYGISARFQSIGLIPFEKGDMSGWSFSLDRLYVPIVRNIPTSVDISGLIQVPLLENTLLGYHATFDIEGNILLNVKLADGDYTFNAFKNTKLTLFENSYIEVKSDGSNFIPKAVLNGQLAIESTTPKIVIGDLVFSDLVIAANPFKFSIGNFALRNKKQYSYSGFPLSIHDIGFFKQGDYSGINFGIKLNLVGEDDNGFSADATLKVQSKITVNENNKVSVEDLSIRLLKASVDVDMGAVSFKGELDSYDSDPVYGDGIKGMVDAKFTGIELSATAQFGMVSNFRYWYVDAMVMMPTPVPLLPELGIYGFGGGAYYHMTRKGPNPTLSSAEGSGIDNSTTAGVTLSGIVYKPDKETYLGLKATVELGTITDRKVFNGNGTLEVAFNNKGGVNTIGIGAKAYFITDVDKRDQANIFAQMDAIMRLDTFSFTANMEMYINAYGLIKGTGANNLAGEASLKFSKNEWYIWIGDPNPKNRVGVVLGDFATIKAYFCVGTKNLIFPSLADIMLDAGANKYPADESKVTKSINQDEMHKGGGFAFGASYQLHADLTFAIFYASLNAFAGFDVMLKNYGGSTSCQGLSGPIGMNGWYAMGQAYAYLDADIGIKYNLKIGFFRIKGQCSILDITAWATLEAKLPHPSWFQGKIGGHYSILGGALQGSCDFKVTLGDKCDFEQQTELSDIPIITSITPDEEAKDVNVFSDIVVHFGQPIGQSFTYDSKGSVVRISITDTSVYYGGKQVPGKWTSSSNGEVFTFKPSIILPSTTQFTVSVKVRPEELKYGNWKPFLDDSNGQVYESKVALFTTGVYDKLTAENIDYCFPLPNQVNYYIGEAIPEGKGYIQLKRPQPSLFILPQGTSQVMRFTAFNKPPIEVQLQSNDDQSINFAMPGLDKGTVYKMEIVNKEGQDKEDILYSSYFRTSLYATVAEKFNSFTSQEILTKREALAFNNLLLKFVGNEFLDNYEINGTKTIAPLVTCEFDTENSNDAVKVDSWISSLSGLGISINTEEAKKKASIVLLDGTPKIMTDTEAQLGALRFDNSAVLISTDIDEYCHSLWNQTAVSGEYPNIHKGGHTVKVKYSIPGKAMKNTEVSEKLISL